ncbi:MAG: hypothetical protein WA057_00330 [Candidatus Magasanikiibacteriota bacterium]
MNFKRMIGFGIMFWIIAFVVLSIIMFLPWLVEKSLLVNIIWWILEIPIVLFWAKAYFKADAPTVKKGFLLGIFALVIGTILDMIFTIPLFVKSYVVYYSTWTLYVGYAWLILLATYAGYEFDGTYCRPSEVDIDKK